METGLHQPVRKPGVRVSSNRDSSHFTPLRCAASSEQWAALRLLVADLHNMPPLHMSGGARRPLVIVAHFGGRRPGKEQRPCEPYTKDHPCKVPKLGKGPSVLGYMNAQKRSAAIAPRIAVLERHAARSVIDSLPFANAFPRFPAYCPGPRKQPMLSQGMLPCAT